MNPLVSSSVARNSWTPEERETIELITNPFQNPPDFNEEMRIVLNLVSEKIMRTPDLLRASSRPLGKRTIAFQESEESRAAKLANSVYQLRRKNIPRQIPAKQVRGNIGESVIDSSRTEGEREQILEAVRSGGVDLANAPEWVKNDREIVEAALRQNGLGLQYLSEDQRDDEDLVLMAITQNPRAIQFASRDYVFYLLEKYTRMLKIYPPETRGRNFTTISEIFKLDPNWLQYVTGPWIVEFIGKTGLEMAKFAGRDTVIKLLKIHPNAFAFIQKQFSEDREIALLAVEKNGLFLLAVSPNFRDSREFVLEALQRNPAAASFANDDLISDLFYHYSVALQAYPPETRDQNYELICLLSHLNPMWMQHAKDTFQIEFIRVNGPSLIRYASRAVVLEILKSNPEAFPLIRDELKSDREIVLRAIQNQGLMLEFVPEGLKEDPEILIAAFTQNGSAIKFVSEAVKSVPFYRLIAVQNNGLALEYLNSDCKKDRDLVMASVNQNGLALQFAGGFLKSDPSILKAAVSQNFRALQYANASLQKDKEMLKVLMNGESWKSRFGSFMDIFAKSKPSS